MGTWTQMEAEQAFRRASRSSLLARLRRGARLAVFDETSRQSVWLAA